MEIGPVRSRLHSRRGPETRILGSRLILNRLTHTQGTLGGTGKQERAARNREGILPWWRLRIMQASAATEPRLRPAEDRDSIGWAVAAGGQVYVASSSMAGIWQRLEPWPRLPPRPLSTQLCKALMETLKYGC